VNHQSRLVVLGVLSAVLLAGCVGAPGATPTSADAPTPTASRTATTSPTPSSDETRTSPPQPTAPPVSNDTVLVGPMAPGCRGDDGTWTYRETARFTRTVDGTWREPETALSLAEESLGMDEKPTVELAVVERNVTRVGWLGEVVDVDAYGAERNVLAQASVTDGSQSVLVLGFDDHTELVVFRVFNVC
jgi:hypothetical protein